eukprot:PLAT11305.1.p1 GENE.PLAT11305.1~~PLAT11305.1.p1  ORF type:complete len:436 (-),score=131.89 PLAT11305.1:94-1401(-)
MMRNFVLLALLVAAVQAQCDIPNLVTSANVAYLLNEGQGTSIADRGRGFGPGTLQPLVPPATTRPPVTAQPGAAGVSGTLRGPLWVSGPSGSALSFNGNSQDVLLPSYTWGGATTVAALVRVDERDNGDRLFDFGNSDGDEGQVFFQLANDNDIQFHVSDRGRDEGVRVTANDVVVPGRWVHLVGTTSSTGVMKLYANGQLSGERAEGATAWQGTRSDSVLGRSALGRQYFFGGALDHLLLYNEELSAECAALLFTSVCSNAGTLDTVTGNCICNDGSASPCGGGIAVDSLPGDGNSDGDGNLTPPPPTAGGNTLDGSADSSSTVNEEPAVAELIGLVGGGIAIVLFVIAVVVIHFRRQRNVTSLSGAPVVVQLTTIVPPQQPSTAVAATSAAAVSVTVSSSAGLLPSEASLVEPPPPMHAPPPPPAPAVAAAYY